MMRRFFGLGWMALLSACGGGGSEGNAGNGAQEITSSSLAQICSIDNVLAPFGQGSTQRGTLSDERQWVKAYLNERYLWYKNMPNVDVSSAAYNVTSGVNAFSNYASSLVNYFAALLNPQVTATGRVDKFSAMTTTALWNQYTQGGDLGYGWKLKEFGTGSTRRIKVAHVFASSQWGLAFSAGVLRGDEILSINGVAVNDALQSTTLNGYLSPTSVVSHSFKIQRNGTPVSLTLTAQDAVLPQAEHKVVTDSQQIKWGYLLFNSHVQSAATPLMAALTEFKNQQVQNLVLDLRYNSGGYLALASALASGVAGPERTQGKTFERLIYNDKRTAENTHLPFYDFTHSNGQAVAGLNLKKIYVLTTGDTCSASESLINGLRGVDVEVVQIGETTCGKPYGFVPQDNCGLTYLAMEFEGVNHKGFGGFADGMVAQCPASDDLSHALGDPAESMFASAIAHHRGLSCASLGSAAYMSSWGGKGLGQPVPKLIQSDWQRGAILGDLRPVVRP